MKRLLVALPFLAVACAQLLSYDDYAERPASVVDTGFVDAPIEEASVDAAPAGARPPLRPEGERKPSGKGKTVWLAVKRYHFGEQNLDGVYAPDGFRYWGFDLDSVCTSATDSADGKGTCKRRPASPPGVLKDGDECRDNNFGQHVVPIIHTYSADFEQNLNDSIYSGSVTWILRIDDLDDGADDPYAPAHLYRATDVPKNSPKWDGSDVRQILSDSVVGGDLGHSVNEFPGGYVKGGVWVAGDPQKQSVMMPVAADIDLKMHLEGMVMTVALDPTRTTVRGMLGGSIPFSSFEDFLRPLLSRGGICPGTSIYTGLLTNVQRTVDLVAGAPNLQDTTKECDALSIGLGIELSPVQPVTELVDPPGATPTKCDDAGP